MSDNKHTCVNSGDCQGMMDARDRAICEQARVIDELRRELAQARAERDYLQRQLDEVWT